MKQKDALFYWGVKVLKAMYPLIILGIIYGVLMLIAAVAVVPILFKHFF